MAKKRKDKIKIAFVDVRYQYFYGSQHSMLTLMNNLNKDRFEPLLVTTEEGGLAQHFRKSSIETHIIKAPPIVNVFGKQILNYSISNKIKLFFELIRYNFKFASWLRKNNVDVVYANDARVIPYIGLGAKMKRLPLVWYVRGDDRINSLFKIGSMLSNRIIMIAEGVKKAFTQNEIKHNSNKFKTLYTGFNIDEFTVDAEKSEIIKKKAGIPSDSQVVGLVAAIEKRKGYHVLLEAAKEIISENPKVHFLLVGDVLKGYEDYYSQLLKKVQELDISDRIHWIGFVEDVSPYYSAMDVLVLPSQSEGLPRVVIEGLTSGLPVVATDVGGVKEIIVNEKLGSVIEVDSSSELKKEVSNFLSHDEEDLKKMRTEYVKNKFSIQSYSEGFEDIIVGLL